MGQQQPPGITRTDLQRQDLSVAGREVVQARVDLTPEAPPINHTHPGEEIIFILEGSLEYQIEDRPTKTFEAGEALTVPARGRSLGEERRKRQRSGARDLRRREREAAPRADRLTHVSGVDRS
jgi:Cupin domain